MLGDYEVGRLYMKSVQEVHVQHVNLIDVMYTW